MCHGNPAPQASRPPQLKLEACGIVNYHKVFQTLSRSGDQVALKRQTPHRRSQWPGQAGSGVQIVQASTVWPDPATGTVSGFPEWKGGAA